MLFGKLSELGGARSPCVPAQDGRFWPGVEASLENYVIFFCNQYSQKGRCFKKEAAFFILVRRLDRKCCRSGSCRNDAAPYYCAKYPGILHNLRSHLDFLGLSDYILSNLAEPSNQHQLHLFNQSKFPLKGGGGGEKIQNTVYKIDYYGSVLQQFICLTNNKENIYLQNFFFFLLWEAINCCTPTTTMRRKKSST